MIEVKGRLPGEYMNLTLTRGGAQAHHRQAEGA